MRRLAILLRRDLVENIQRPLIIFWALFMALNAFMASRGNWIISSVDTSIGGQKDWVTSEFSIAYIAALIGFFLMAFFVSIAVGMPLVRDEEFGVGPLIHSTPLTTGQYIWGKFLAAYIAGLGVVAAFMGSWILFAHGTPNLADPEIYGPFALINYLRPFVVFVVPAVTVAAGASFLVAVIFRRGLALFIFPVFSFFFFNTLVWFWYPTDMGATAGRWLQWLDPSGFRWLKQNWLVVDRGLTFYNLEPVVYDAAFLISRFVWVVAGFALVVLAQRWFARRKSRTRATWRLLRGRAGKTEVATRSVHIAPELRSLEMTSRPRGSWRATLTILRAELRELRSRGALWLFLVVIFYFTSVIFNVFTGAFGTRLMVTSGVAAVSLVVPLGMWIALVLLFFIPDSLHREEATRIAPIFRSLPVSTGAMLAGKLLAMLALVLAAMITSGVSAFLSVSASAAMPYSVMPFLLVWGLLLLPSLVLWAVFVTAAYAATGSRMATYGMGGAALFATAWAILRGHMHWVFNWGLVGVLSWSDISVFELDRVALVLNRLLVVSLAALLTWLSLQLFRRRQSDRVRSPRGRVGSRTPVARAVAVVLVAAPLVLGWMLWSEVAGGSEGSRAEEARKSYWRENLATWRDAPAPHLTAVDLDVELFPDSRSFRVAGWYDLENRTTEPMRRFPVTGGLFWSDVDWTLDGATTSPEDRAGLFILEPEAPLAPGTSVRLGFTLEGTWPKGPTAKIPAEIEQFVLPSGVVLTGRNPEFVPVVGYLELLGIDDENRYEPEDAPIERHLGLVDGDADRSWFDCRLRITAPADMTVNATGVKVGETVSGDRKTVIWESDYPIRVFNMVAGRWEVAEGEEGTSVFHHPGHSANVEVMLEALDGARRHYSEWFHPYPWRELRLNEFPALATYAMGNATNILFSENTGFLADPSDTNGAFAIAAHEAAHSWFGHIVGNGGGPGGIVLSEGGAHFATLMLIEELRGPAARMDFARRLETTYGESRQPDTERPLVSTTWHRPGDFSVIYDRGAWVFWMLERQMGREAFLAGMREYFETFHMSLDHPLLPDLTGILRRHAADPEAFDAVVEQFLYDTMIPEYRVAAAERSPAGDRWISRLRILNNGSGRIPVEVAVTAGGRRFDVDGELRAEHRESRGWVEVGAGEEVDIEIVSDFEPERVVVDPDHNVLMLQRKAASVRFTS